GTRLDPPTGKLMFCVYDYTNATRLFGEQFLSKMAAKKRDAEGERPDVEREREHAIVAEGFEVRVTSAGRYIMTTVDGKALPVTVEEYKQRLAARLVEEAPTLAAFRARWIAPADRRHLLSALPGGAAAASMIRTLEGLDDCDLYDVLADLAYGLAPRTRAERA